LKYLRAAKGEEFTIFSFVCIYVLKKIEIHVYAYILEDAGVDSDADEHNMFWTLCVTPS
jgi:predicted transcriptional regulator